MTLTPAEIVEMMKEYQTGVAVSDLEKKWGVPRHTIQRIRREMGIVAQNPAAVRKEDIALAKQMMAKEGKKGYRK